MQVVNEVVLTFELKSSSVTIQMKAIEQYLAVVRFVSRYFATRNLVYFLFNRSPALLGVEYIK